MEHLIVVCNSQSTLAQLKSHLEGLCQIQIQDHSLFLTYSSSKASAIDAILDPLLKDESIQISQNKADAAGRLRTHLRIAPSPLNAEINTRAIGNGNLPTLFGAHYNYPAQKGIAPKIGIISLGGTYLTSDLLAFWRLLGRTTPLPNIAWQRTDGLARSAPNQTITQSNEGASQENTLDLEIMIALCPQAQITIYFGSNTTNGFYTAFNKAILDRNRVISCSWGAPEQYYATSTLNLFDTLFARAVAQGTTICAAAGDNGSGDGVSSTQPAVDFPGCCPHVVCCGGTSLNLANNSETVWSWNPTYQWGGGGGISRIFAKPSYQRSVTYPTGTRPAIPASGRSLPDVSLNADPFQGWSIYFNGHLYQSAFGGTSAAAPAFAALLGLANKTFSTAYGAHDYLYSHSGFRDITVGSNDSLRNSVGAYNARVGYDQCTGLGSVNGSVLFP